MKRAALLLGSLRCLLAQDATFIVDTKLVVINVTVKDKAGRPITNLKKEDFQFLEDGVPQKITVFDRQDLSTEPLAPMSFRAASANHRRARRRDAPPGSFGEHSRSSATPNAFKIAA